MKVAEGLLYTQIFEIRFKVKFKFKIYIYIYIYIYIPIQTLLVYFRNRHLSFHIFSLTIMTYLKMLIGIKSLNTKQYPARLSPPHVKLSSFVGGKFSPKQGESNL